MATNNWQPSPRDVAWSANHFRFLANGGVWAMTAGLIWRKSEQPDTLTLTTVMPWSEEIGIAAGNGADVPQTADELLSYQRTAFERVAICFRAIPIQVVDATGIFEPLIAERNSSDDTGTQT